MGSGSSTEVNAHLRRWDQAIGDLSSLCRDHRRALDNQSPTNDGYRSESSRETESHSLLKKHVEKGGDLNKSQGDDDADVVSERSLRRRTSSLVSFGKKDLPNEVPLKSPSNRSRGADIVLTPETSPQSRRTEEKESQPKHKNRQQVKTLKTERTNLYKSYIDMPLDEVENPLSCSHFGVVAIALSSLLGGHRDCQDRKKRVTVEDLFFSAQISLHYLHTRDMSLTAMYDIVREFIDVDNRFKNQYLVEVVHLDIAPTVGQVEIGTNETGDRQARIQLPEFRKGIAQELEEDMDCVRILNYDPFIVEQAMIMDEDGDPSDDGESAQGEDALRNSFCAAVSPVARGKKPHWHNQKYKKENNGKFAALVDFRSLAVQPMVTVAETAVDDKIHASLSEVPVATMFKAMRQAQPGCRAKGYLRIWKRKENEDNCSSQAGQSGQNQLNDDTPDVAYFYSPELCTGKVLGSLMAGTHAQHVSEAISPHITAFAWALHLLGGVRPDCHGYGSGLPINDIITTLQLPSDVFMSCPLPLDQVHIYAQDYLKAKQLKQYSLQLCPVLTKVSRDDAVPTVSVFDLEGILIEVKNSNEDPEAPVHVMILQYNADIAHNALNIANDPQWCILAGYDEDNQVARMIDANPSRFCASWTVPLDRLHKAITNFGYIVVSNTEPQTSTKSTRSSQSSVGSANNQSYSVGGLRHVTSTVQQRLDLLSAQSKRFVVKDALSYFSYPPTPIPSTQIAVALTKLGHFTTLENLVHTLPYDVSSMTNATMSLQSFGFVMNEYITRMGLSSKFTLKIYHADRDADNMQSLPLQKFVNLLKAAVCSAEREDHVMIVHYAKAMINVFGANQPVGEYGVVTAFNEETNTVTISDLNHNRFFRSWEVNLQTLHEAISKGSASAHRSRGCVVLRKNKEDVEAQLPLRHRDFHLMLAPVQQVFNVSPSPQMQGLSLACAQLGFSYSPEEIFYEAYLKTMSDQRRRGSQAFAWRDVEVSLAVVNTRITAHVMALVMRKFLDSRKIFSLGVEVIDDVDASDLDDLLNAATDNTADHILLLNYNTDVAHGLPFGNSVALVQSYDPESKSVGMFEAEYTLFGLQWKCSLDTLVEAGDLDNDGRSDYGFVKIFKKDPNDSSAKGKGFTFGGGGGGFNSGFPTPGANDTEPRQKATFVE